VVVGGDHRERRTVREDGALAAGDGRERTEPTVRRHTRWRLTDADWAARMGECRAARVTDVGGERPATYVDAQCALTGGEPLPPLDSTGAGVFNAAVARPGLATVKPN